MRCLENNISIIAVIAFVIAGYGDGYAGEDKRPDISGVWKNALLSPDDERWRIEDSCLCPLGLFPGRI